MGGGGAANDGRGRARASPGASLPGSPHRARGAAWTYGGNGHGPSRLVELVGAAVPPGTDLTGGCVWVAGQTDALRAVRRYLRRGLKLPAERFKVVGHWMPDGPPGPGATRRCPPPYGPNWRACGPTRPTSPRTWPSGTRTASASSACESVSPRPLEGAGGLCGPPVDAVPGRDPGTASSAPPVRPSLTPGRIGGLR
ncbi:SIP domain-containing protein [Streptomyces sp. AmelKG-A3]|uniref:SIP domain-containing protein n=1 Tax=Streptomyces sp. AmelKG-A3 TaxID=1115567 RepID=UPI00210D5AB9|nr:MULTISPECIES: SIP domain-containing protein [unclassified Streptomyces]